MIKLEQIEADVESGELTPEENYQIIHVKKIKLRRRKKRIRKQDKADNCTTEDSNDDDFSPYKVRIQYVYSPLMLNHLDVLDKTHTTPLNDISNDKFNNKDNFTDTHLCNVDIKKTVDATNKLPAFEVVYSGIVNPMIDITGIDCSIDIIGKLRSLGFSVILVKELSVVLNKTDVDDETECSDDGDESRECAEFQMEENEEEERELDIPMIVPGNRTLEVRYSPEPVIDNQRINYGPKGPVLDILDINSIPSVSVTDPRILNKTIPITRDKTIEMENGGGCGASAADVRDWNNQVVEFVKKLLKPYLIFDDITKMEYRSIWKKAVSKIVESGDRKLDTDKVAAFLYSYVTLTQKNRSQ